MTQQSRMSWTHAVLPYMAMKALLGSPLTTSLLVVAVTGAVAFQIPNSANLDGYTAELLDKGASRDSGHLTVRLANDEPMREVSQVVRSVERLPFVRGVMIRLVQGGVLRHETRNAPVRVVGVDFAREGGEWGTCGRLQEGRCPRQAEAREIVLGQKAAAKVGARCGTPVKLLVASDFQDPIEEWPSKFEVVGVLKGGGGFEADSSAYLARDWLLGQTEAFDAASSIGLVVQDPKLVEQNAAAVRQAVPGYVVKTWWSASDFVANAVEGNRRVARISTLMAIVSVAVPVLALLYVNVMHERRQIAVLSSVGLLRGEVFLYYLYRTALVGLVGVLLGSGLGLLVCRYFAHHPIFAEAGFVVTPLVGLRTIVVPAVVVFLVTLLAGLVPALLAARADPAAELRKG